MIITIILIYLALAFLSFYRAKDQNLENSVLRMNRAYLLVGIFCTLGFLLFAILAFILQDDVYLPLVLCVFSIFSFSLVVAYFNCRLFYDETSMTNRNFFGRKTTIFYNEITDVDIGIEIIISSDKKRIKIPEYTIGREKFAESIKPYVENILEVKSQLSEPMPKVRKFRDSVQTPGDFIFMIVLMILFSLFFIGVALFYDFNFLCLGFAFFGFLFAFLMFYSPKRAHSSAFWRAIAKGMYRKGYVKGIEYEDEADNTDDNQEDDDF